MTEKGLDGADVGAVHEKIGSKRVAKGVRRDVLGDAGHFGVFFYDTLDGARGETAKIAGSVNGLLVFAVV